MILSVAEARTIMGETVSKKYSDPEVEELVNVLSAIANFAIDSYIEMKRKRKEVG
jgi:hypothetical protein